MTWAPSYVTKTELAEYVGISDSVDDTRLDLAIAAASRAIDRATNRQFGKVAAVEERFYTAQWDRGRGRWVVEIDDLMTQTGLVVSTDAGTVDTFALQPRNAVTVGRPWTRLVVDPASSTVPNSDEDDVSVTALWGWTTVPDTIKEATLLQASRFFTRKSAPFGVAGSPDQGSEMRLLAKVDPDVAVMVGSYYRWWVAA